MAHRPNGAPAEERTCRRAHLPKDAPRCLAVALSDSCRWWLAYVIATTSTDALVRRAVNHNLRPIIGTTPMTIVQVTHASCPQHTLIRAPDCVLTRARPRARALRSLRSQLRRSARRRARANRR